MEQQGPLTVRRLAERLGGVVDGNGDAAIRGFASLDDAGPDEVSFAADLRRASLLDQTRAGAVIVDRQAPAAGVPLIRVDNVAAAVAGVLAMLAPPEDFPPPGIHPTATVAEDAEIGEGVAVGPGAVVGSGARLGAGAVLAAGAQVQAGASIGPETVLLSGTIVARRCRIGARCRIGPNAVIGSSGFGYYFDGARHARVEHAGTVEIGDEVDIGACSCVDRAKFGATRVGDGTKIDNLVQIAHNVQIGAGCLLPALTGIAGSTELGEYVVFGGHVGVRDNIKIGRGAQCAAFSSIAQDVPDGAVISGVPAFDVGAWRRSTRLFTRFSELYERIKTLEKRLEALESTADH